MKTKNIFSLHFYLFLILMPANFSCTQNHLQHQNKIIDTTEFYDSAHHWYDINDEQKTIIPESDQKKYDPTEIIKIADNILLYQKSNGGWPKNYDMQAILSDEQKNILLKSRNELNTTFDNGATYSQMNYLAKVYSQTKIEKYKQAFVKGLQFVLSAQYDNGGWPQFYPDRSGYRKYITFNDGAMVGIMNGLRKIALHKKEFSFIDDTLYEKVKSSYLKGIECILSCQIYENEKLTAWCQQHDNIDFRPQKARTFEPASISNGESSAIVKFLMSTENPNKKIIKSVTSAIRWFEDSRIYGIRVEEINADKVDYKYHSTELDKIIVVDSTAKPIWTRFYELGTHRPMFCNRDGQVVYSLEEVERERRTGYAWYVYDPQEVLDLYPAWSAKWLKK